MARGKGRAPRKFPSAAQPAMGTIVVEEAPEIWEDEVSALEAAAPPGPHTWGRVVFTGSSTIRGWSTLETDMAPRPVRNHGIGGAQADALVHYAPRLVVAYRPCAVVVYAGENDLEAFRGKTPERVLADVAHFHSVVTETGSLLLLLSLKSSPARSGDRDAVLRFNVLLRDYAASGGCGFADVAAATTNSDGRPDLRCFLDDGLHLSPAGYARWTTVVRSALGEQLDRRRGTGA